MGKYMTYFRTFTKYSFLLTLLVKKDIKKKYKESFLGILWSLINPLLIMIILTIVFSTLFNQTIENFPVYLLCGRLLFSFFVSSTTTSMKSVINSGNLISKVYIPKYIFPLSNVVSNFIFFLISLIDLVIIMLVTQAEITINILYAPVYLILLFIFCCGVSLILSTITIFFRDIEHLYSVITTAIMYASAIFYPVHIIPDKYQFIVLLNPLFYFIDGFRDVVYRGVPLDWINILICIAISILSLLIGLVIFKRNQDKFILRI